MKGVDKIHINTREIHKNITKKMKRIIFNIIDVSFDCAVIAGFLIGAWNTLAPNDWCWLDTTISLLSWSVSTVFLILLGLGYCIHEQEKEEAEKHKTKTLKRNIKTSNCKGENVTIIIKD